MVGDGEFVSPEPGEIVVAWVSAKSRWFVARYIGGMRYLVDDFSLNSGRSVHARYWMRLPKSPIWEDK